MTIIKGKRGCDTEKNCTVRLRCVNDSIAKVAEQLTEEEAKEIYSKLKTELENKSEWIEIEYIDRGEFTRELFNKRNILSIEWY